MMKFWDNIVSTIYRKKGAEMFEMTGLGIINNIDVGIRIETFLPINNRCQVSVMK